jgi:hypothetical protein
MALEIANTIKDQIGSKAFYMLGAQNLAGDENSLTFKIRGSRKVTHIKVKLDPDDTYEMTFWKALGYNFKTVKVIPGVYAEDLNRMIRETTGLATNL